MPNPDTERRQEYIHLNDLIRELATVIANLNNLLQSFSKHVASDEETHKEMSDRIKVLELKETNMQGKIWGVGVGGGLVGSALGSVLTFVITHGGKLFK